jgi:carbamoyl-phosphate synthase small subunit
MKIFKNNRPRAILALADGTYFSGYGFGDIKDIKSPVIGEVVFNTSLYGYQEITTDPSYAGQIMCFTYPQIGNVGSNSKDWESDKVYTEGVIIKAETLATSNFRAEESFDSFLRKSSKMGISGIDTRALVQHLRDNGSQMGAMACGDLSIKDELVNYAKQQGSMLGKDYVTAVTCKENYNWTSGLWSLDCNDFKNYTSKLITHH